jgi:exodeoxyribonuclease VIII
VTEREYRQHPAISRSELWRMHESPEKFKYFKEHPPEPTPSLLFGQVVHKLLLQPEYFESDFTIIPNVDGRTRAGKEALKLIENTDGRARVKYDMYETASLMVEKAMSEPLVRKLLSGQKEQPFFWTDADTGEQCKCRTDCLTEIGDNLIIVDYKTCNDASTDVFMREAVKFGYEFQSAMYSEGVERNTGRKPLFVFIAQEKAEPYSLNILQADEAFVLRGYDRYREFLGIYHYCKENNDWYGYMGKEKILNTLTLPSWMKGDNE